VGTVYTHRCSECDYSFETSGPWEFYRTDDGSIKAYGHPVPGSLEAQQRGVYGLRAEVYCPACDDVMDVILVSAMLRPTKRRPSALSGATLIGRPSRPRKSLLPRTPQQGEAASGARRPVPLSTHRRDPQPF